MHPNIVTFCDKNYITVGKNWLNCISKLGLRNNVKIITLDDETRNEFDEDISIYKPLPLGDHDLNSLWVHRMKVLFELLENEGDLIHSDADALWLKNPFNDIQQCNADVVFTQGTIWPPDVHLKQGFVLCCGFFYLSQNTRTFKFMNKVLSRLLIEKDDQVAVNRVVAESLQSWDIKQPYKVAFRSTHFVASRSIISSSNLCIDGEVLKVALLPHHKYPRLLKEILPEFVVVHPLSGKTSVEKKEIFANLGLWN